ncbi:MAG TPA: NAD-dependent epimerase/dehydratase family protein [Bacteroidales bacterium]|nr:NAD-dependent epimerase/dehydratase family protein [Bacteroidales bacterium]HPT20324.1 NAD-dependent epimerase/dehydratase family protein [Bacteroidales bacterium]
MLRVGITGQAGFVGSHLFNTLGLFPDKYTRIPFEDGFFSKQELLNNFVSQCDVIVHLAAMNRHNDPNVIYSTNIELVKKLISACETTESRPHILFSSSTQEERDNPYGKSKREGREMLGNWASANKARFTGLIIPNVYGPFGNPYYNSVVATFCHQLTHGEQPRIDTDGELKLIYVGELVAFILGIIGKDPERESSGARVEQVRVPHTAEIKVSQILNLLEEFKQKYFEKGEMPSLDNEFQKNLFNTFVCYIDHSKFYPFHLVKNTDNRGSFIEVIKLSSGGQVSFSTTHPGITRGNHFHTRKAERFAVIKGKATIEIRRIGTDKKLSFELDGEEPSFVDMPVWYTHNITNTGNEDLYTFFWINEKYNADDPDTWFESV